MEMFWGLESVISVVVKHWYLVKHPLHDSIEVGEGGSDMWHMWHLVIRVPGKTHQTRATGVGFGGWLWVNPYPYPSHPYPGTRVGLQTHDRP